MVEGFYWQWLEGLIHLATGHAYPGCVPWMACSKTRVQAGYTWCSLPVQLQSPNTCSSALSWFSHWYDSGGNPKSATSGILWKFLAIFCTTRLHARSTNGKHLSHAVCMFVIRIFTCLVPQTHLWSQQGQLMQRMGPTKWMLHLRKTLMLFVAFWFLSALRTYRIKSDIFSLYSSGDRWQTLVVQRSVTPCQLRNHWLVQCSCSGGVIAQWSECWCA